MSSLSIVAYLVNDIFEQKELCLSFIFPGLAGKGRYEEAVVDSIVDTANDILGDIIKIIFNEDEKLKVNRLFFLPTILCYLFPLVKMLQLQIQAHVTWHVRVKYIFSSHSNGFIIVWWMGFVWWCLSERKSKEIRRQHSTLHAEQLGERLQQTRRQGTGLRRGQWCKLHQRAFYPLNVPPSIHWMSHLLSTECPTFYPLNVSPSIHWTFHLLFTECSTFYPLNVPPSIHWTSHFLSTECPTFYPLNIPPFIHWMSHLLSTECSTFYSLSVPPRHTYLVKLQYGTEHLVFSVCSWHMPIWRFSTR